MFVNLRRGATEVKRKRKRVVTPRATPRPHIHSPKSDMK